MMKNSGLPAASISPCLRLFIESLLDGVAAEAPTNEAFISGGVLPMRTFSSSPRESDTGYK